MRFASELLMAGCALAIFSRAEQVLAQDAEKQPGALAAEPSEIPSTDIVVTARRKSERLMEVPVVVSVLSTEAVERY